MQRFFRRFEAAGGIEPGRKLKTDFVNADGVVRLRDFFQRDNPGALGLVQLPQAGGSENAVFACQRNEVGNRSQRDQIQQRLQIKFRHAGQIFFAPAFNDGMREFKGKAGGAKFGRGMNVFFQ